MPKKKKPELPEGDDGHAIANMNVEGMPWYRPEKAEINDSSEEPNAPHVSREEARYYTWGALKAALLVVGAMCAGIVLFVLFCQFIWFR